MRALAGGETSPRLIQHHRHRLRFSPTCFPRVHVDPCPLPLLPSYVCPPPRNPFGGRQPALLEFRWAWGPLHHYGDLSCLPSSSAVSTSSSTIPCSPMKKSSSATPRGSSS